MAHRIAVDTGEAGPSPVVPVPSGTQVGDLAVLWYAGDGTAVATPPAGWTAVAGVTWPVSNPQARAWLWWHVVTAGDLTAGSWTVSGTGGWSEALISVFTGRSTTAPVTAVSVYATSFASLADIINDSLPPVTAVAGDDVLIVGGAYNFGTTAPGSGWTAATSYGNGLASFYRASPAGGVIDPSGFVDGGQTINPVAALVALAAAGGSAPSETRTATGALTLAGAATATASGGSLSRTATGALTIAGAATTSVAGGTLSRTASGALTLAGAAAVAGGSLARTALGTLTLAGQATGTAAGGAVSRTASGALTLAGAAAVTGGSLTRTATGTLVLAGSVTVAGAATVTATGILTLAGTAAAVASGGTVTRTAVGTLLLTGDATVAGGAVTRTATGVLALVGTGDATTAGGALARAASGTLVLAGAATAAAAGGALTRTATGALAISGSADVGTGYTRTATGTLVLAGTAPAVTAGGTVTRAAIGLLELTGTAVGVAAGGTLARVALGVLALAGSGLYAPATDLWRDLTVLVSDRRRTLTAADRRTTILVADRRRVITLGRPDMRIRRGERVLWAPGLTVLDAALAPVVIDPARWEASFDGGATWCPSRVVSGGPRWLVADAAYPLAGDDAAGIVADHVYTGPGPVPVAIRLRDTPETIISDGLAIQRG